MAKPTRCNCGKDHDAKLSKPKKEYLESWDDERCKKMWATLTKGAKVHKMSACMRNASGAKNPAGLCKALAIRVGYEPKREGEVESTMPSKTASTVRVATLQIRSARVLRRVQRTGRFIYSGYIYQKVADAPAEDVSKAKLPPTDAVPDWVEDGYDARKNEKAPKNKWPEEKPVPAKQVKDSKEPEPVEAAGKGKAVAPAESVKTFKGPDADLEPEWVENGYSTRKKEKGPKPGKLEEVAVPPKAVETAKTPMEVKTGAKSKLPKYSLLDLDDEDGLRNLPKGPIYPYIWEEKGMVICFKDSYTNADLKAVKEKIKSED